MNGSDLCWHVFGKNGTTKHKEFKAFFSAADPRKPVPPTTSHPNWKVDAVLKHMMRVSKEVVCIGQDISVDEQDIGFQGRHRDKQRISYKKVGDGFLVVNWTGTLVGGVNDEVSNTSWSMLGCRSCSSSKRSK